MAKLDYPVIFRIIVSFCCKETTIIANFVREAGFVSVLQKCFGYKENEEVAFSNPELILFGF